MKRLLEIIQQAERFLANKGIARPRREAEEVIADVLGMKRLDLYLQFERPLNEEELSRLRAAIQRRGKHEPAAYIAGRVDFAGVSLHVNPSVLIPRPETELLVEKIAQTLVKLDLKGKVLWDLCCGSGCIGIALKHRFPELEVVGSDLSEEAITVARQNSDAVDFRVGDLFAPFKGERCDFFVCNPPYVTEEEYPNLDPSVRDWEPKGALVGGDTFYRRIAQELEGYLAPGGLGWLELGTGQGARVKTLFESLGWPCRFETDWAGHDRFFSLENERNFAVH